MALGWVRSEAIAVDEQGQPHDLTIRSFGILRAVDTPTVDVEIDRSAGPSVNGSDAVFAAVAAAAWRRAGFPARWPVER
jgi:xanthine dehydrogenase small subunit